MQLPLESEQIFSLVLLATALAIAIGALRGNLRFSRWQKGQAEENAKRKRRGEFGGPWGG